MKKYYQITKIGNSLFATLSNKLVKQLGLKPGDRVAYELIPGKKQVTMHILPKGLRNSKEIILEDLNEEDKKWIKESAGSLSVK